MNKWLIGAVVVLLGLVVFQFEHHRRASSEAARVLESEKLRTAGFIPADLVAQKELERRATEMSASNKSLAEELTRLKVELGKKPKVAAAAQATTGAVVANGQPREEKSEPSGAPESQTPSPIQPACLLAQGDLVEVQVDELVVETKTENFVLVGTAQCWRLKPGPKTVIAGGKFTSDTKFKMPKPPPPLGVGYGLWAGVGDKGGLLGVAVAAPPFTVLSLRFDATLGVGLNFSGGWGASATLIAR